MANLHDRDIHNHDGNSSETHHGTTNGNVDPGRATSYRDGYVHGRVSENHLQEERLEVRDNNNAARGLLIGIALTSLLGLGLAALFFWNQRQEEVPTQIVVPQTSASPSPAATQEPNQQTIIRERTVEQVPQVVPVPQQAAPQQSAPRVNINVPQQTAPAPKTDVKITLPSVQQQAPARQNTTNGTSSQSQTQTRPDTSGTDQGSPSNSTTETAPADTGDNNTNSGTQNQTGTPSGGISNPGSTTNSNP